MKTNLMKLSIVALGIIFSGLAFGETTPETVCTAEISKSLEIDYYSSANLDMFDHAGPTKVIARAEKLTVQKSILSADGGHSIYEVVTRNRDCKVLAIEFVYLD